MRRLLTLLTMAALALAGLGAGTAEAKTQPAKLTLALTPPTTTVARNHWVRIGVMVADTGGRTARSLRLRVRTPKAVTASRHTLTLSRLAPGKHHAFTIRLRLGTKAKIPARVRVSVSATGVKATTATLAVRLGAAAKQTPGTGTGSTPAPGTSPSSATSLAGTYFTHVELSPLSGGDWSALAFVDAHWVYRGISAGGLPTCTARTAVDIGDGCLPYTYDPATNTLTIDGQPATIQADHQSITYLDFPYSAAVIPAAGARWALTLEAISVSGYPPDDVATTTDLTMAPDGQFAAPASTSGPPGFVAEPAFGALPADQHGTYAVGSRGDLHLTYADGHAVVATIAILRDPDTGNADPAVVGFLLDGLQYSKPNL